MSIIEVKNNLIKFCYEEDLILSGFVKIADAKNSYIAQVLHLEATRIGKVAIAKILFMYTDDGITSYNGSIPSLRSEVSAVSPSVLLDTLEKKAPLNLGNLAQQDQKLVVDMSVLEDNPIICAEKFFATKVFLNNLALQLQHNYKKVIVFDTLGIFKSNKLTLGKDFKLPLNESAINYIYEHGFGDTTAESKAMIQSIFEALSEYAKTVPFIPFNNFRTVINDEFMRTKLIQLVLLKNKIKQIGDKNIYVQTQQDYDLLPNKIKSETTIVIDISGVSESLQKECIKYVYSVLENSGEEFYAFLPLSNNNSDKELLSYVYSAEKTHTTVICNYDYKFLTGLKQTSKNMFMFTPLKQQKDFGGYNIFLQKLAEDEFIAYGKMTKFVPMITKIHPIRQDEIVVSQQPQQTLEQAYVPERVSNEVITEFVNTITPESVNLQTQEPQSPTFEQQEEVLPVELQPEETVQEELSQAPVESDMAETPQALDAQEEITQEPDEPQELTSEEVVVETEGFSVQEMATQVHQQEPQPIDTITEEPIVSEPIAQEPIQEVQQPDVPQPQELTAAEEAPEPLQATEAIQPQPPQESAVTEEAHEIQPEPQTEAIAQEQVPTSGATDDNLEPNEQLAQALEEIPEIEDEDELSDDDLDMIEELSNKEETQQQAVQEQAEVPPQAEQQVPQPQPEPQPQPMPQPQPAPQPAPQPQPMPQPAPQPMPQPAPAPQPAPQPTAQTNATVPIYSSDIPEEDVVSNAIYKQGDRVLHEEFGEGVVEKMINYGDKELCSINFASVGRRLLNPEITEMRKI